MSAKAALLAGFAVAALAVAAVAIAGRTSEPMMGMGGTISRPAFHGYYDGHKDVFLNTDVSSKTEAAMMHVNYSARIGKVKNLPEIYFVQGAAAKGQLAILGSEPGEPDYSPLWDEVIVTWKAGVKPTLITKDDDVDKLEKQGMLEEHDTGAVLNCPVVKVGK
jgi:hypothetical protein